MAGGKLEQAGLLPVCFTDRPLEHLNEPVRHLSLHSQAFVLSFAGIADPNNTIFGPTAGHGFHPRTLNHRPVRPSLPRTQAKIVINSDSLKELKTVTFCQAIGKHNLSSHKCDEIGARA